MGKKEYDGKTYVWGGGFVGCSKDGKAVWRAIDAHPKTFEQVLLMEKMVMKAFEADYGEEEEENGSESDACKGRGD
jgi:hypothetical protein